MKNSIALAVCTLGLLSFEASAEDKKNVIYRVVETVETKAYPVSQQEAMADDLVKATEGAQRDTARGLQRTDGLQFAGNQVVGGGLDQYKRPDPSEFFKPLGEQKVEAAPTTRFGRFAAWVTGTETSPDDSLPTFEPHFQGVAKVESLFIAPRNSLAQSQLPEHLRSQGVKFTEVAQKAAVMVYAEEDGRTAQSLPIHVTPEELAALANDPKGKVASDLRDLISSTYRHQILAPGAEDHSGIEPVVVVRTVHGPHSLGENLLVLDDEKILDRTSPTVPLSSDEVIAAQQKRERAQFAEERMARRVKEAQERANANQPAGKAQGAGSKVNGLFD